MGQLSILRENVWGTSAADLTAARNRVRVARTTLLCGCSLMVHALWDYLRLRCPFPRPRRS